VLFLFNIMGILEHYIRGKPLGRYIADPVIKYTGLLYGASGAFPEEVSVTRIIVGGLAFLIAKFVSLNYDIDFDTEIRNSLNKLDKIEERERNIKEGRGSEVEREKWKNIKWHV